MDRLSVVVQTSELHFSDIVLSQDCLEALSGAWVSLKLRQRALQSMQKYCLCPTPNEPMFATYCGDVLIGTTGYFTAKYFSKDTVGLRWTCILEAYRGLGLFPRMMELLYVNLRQNTPAKYLCEMVPPNSPQIIQQFERVGFVVERKITDCDHDFDGGVYMRKAL